MKQQVTLELEVPEGYEVTGEYRMLEKGDIYISYEGLKAVATESYSGAPRFILKKKWEWPTWLKARCIVKHEEGKWFSTTSIPVLVVHYWSRGGHWCELSSQHLDITFPAIEDYTKSLILNPNYKGSSDE